MQARVVHESNSTTNPVTGKVIHSYETTDTKQISRIVSDAKTAFSRAGFYYEPTRLLTINLRIPWMKRLNDVGHKES